MIRTANNPLISQSKNALILIIFPLPNTLDSKQGYYTGGIAFWQFFCRNL